MGDPRKARKKYITPNHPWKQDRIVEEKKLITEYGLKNHIELWKINFMIKGFKNRAKELIFRDDESGAKEKDVLLSKLRKFGLTSETSTVNDVFNLNIRQFLDRRLETLLVKKGLAKTMRQARQFISHGHVVIDDRKITSPSYLVTKKEEGRISFNVSSSLFKEDHPERVKITGPSGEKA